MSDKYALIFNSENPPRGTQNNEMFNQALARFRRILLHEIKIWGVSGVIIQLNGSVIQDGDLVNRLASIPILKKPDTMILSLNIQAPIDKYVEILSDFITTTSGNKAPVKDNIVITILPANEKLSVNLILKYGSVKTTDNTYFSPISAVTFYSIDSEKSDFQFVIELVNGYTEDDFNNFLEQAYVAMENGGGEVTDSARKSGLLKSKMGKYDILELDARQKLEQDDNFVNNIVGDYS